MQERVPMRKITKIKEKIEKVRFKENVPFPNLLSKWKKTL